MHKNVIFGRISSSMLKLASPGGDVATRGAEVYGLLSPPVARQGVNCGLTQEDRLELEPIYTIRFMINQE